MRTILYVSAYCRNWVMVLALIFTLSSLSTIAQNWEQEAWTRIDTHRKSDLNLTLLSANGTPLPDASVRIKLTNHAFQWGAVTHSETMNTSPYANIYKEKYLKYFNSAGIQNGLKPKQRGKNSEEHAEDIFPWFLDNGFPMRGHALVWEGENWLPDDALAIYLDTSIPDSEKGQMLIDVLDDHFYHALPKWNVFCWDAVNEPWVNNLVNNFVPQNTFSDWFKLARDLRTYYNLDFDLVLNENQIISGNHPNVANKLSEFQAIIDDMLADGAPIEVLGFQSRIKHGMLSPEVMYERLVSFDKYNLPYQATEFEIRDSNLYTYTDEEVQQLTEDAMMAYFSHPSVEGFWHWSFAERAEGGEPWAMYNYDGTPKATAVKWEEMLDGPFNTDENVTTNSSGVCSTRGFKGEYEIEITYGGNTITRTITLDDDANETINTHFIVEGTESENLLVNGDFETGDHSPWGFFILDADASAAVHSGQLNISITTPTAVWKPQLQQTGFSITSGKEYILSFDADAVADRTVDIRIQSENGDSLLSVTQNLVTGSKYYSIPFTAVTGDTNCRIRFNCGSSATNFNLDNVSIMEVPVPSIFQLTVYKGSGSGEYEAGSIVDVLADAAPAGQGFSHWGGNYLNVADVNSANTTYLMPALDRALAARYVTTLINDGDFEAGNLDSWNFYSNDNGAASIVNGQAYIEVNSVNADFWKPQLLQDAIDIQNGNSYKIKFDAKAESNRTMNVVLKSSTGATLLNETVDLTTTMQTFLFERTATFDDANSVIKFNFGSSNANVTLDYILVTDLSNPGAREVVESSSRDLDLEIVPSFQLFPNPTSGWININNEGTYSFTIRSLDGKVVYSASNLVGEKKIDLSSLTKGFYLITLENSKSTKTERIVLK